MKCIPLDCPELCPHIFPVQKKLKRIRPRTIETLMQDGHNGSATLQDKLIWATVLPFPHSKKTITVDTDASDKPIGCVSVQEQTDERKKRFSFRWRTLNAAEQIYDATHQECSAIVRLFSDNANICWGMNAPFSWMTMRWNGSVIWLTLQEIRAPVIPSMGTWVRSHAKRWIWKPGCWRLIKTRNNCHE